MSKATSVSSNTAIFLADSEEMKLSGVKSGERGTDPMAMLKKVIQENAMSKLIREYVHEALWQLASACADLADDVTDLMPAWETILLAEDDPCSE